MPSLDPLLIGWWKVLSTAMPRGKVLGLIGGLPGERVSFSEAGHYNVFPMDSDSQCFRCGIAQPYRELDIWIRGLETLTALCIYTIEDDTLKITVTGRLSGEDATKVKRPTEMRMDELLNWAVIEMKRCQPPKRRVPTRTQTTSAPTTFQQNTQGSINLKDFLSKPDKTKADKPKGWLHFCTLEVTSGALWAGDPHLANAEDGCVVKVSKGKYIVEGIGGSLGSDRVVSKLRVRLESVQQPTIGEEIGDAGTDSAMIGVCDIKAFDAACGAESGDEVQEAIEEETAERFGIITIETCPGAVMPFVPTGSDGRGPVFALIYGGKCVGIELPFMDEDEKA